MRDQQEIEKMMSSSVKDIEKEIGIQIRNGQTSSAIKKTLNWVLGNKNKILSVSEKYGVKSNG